MFYNPPFKVDSFIVRLRQFQLSIKPRRHLNFQLAVREDVETPSHSSHANRGHISSSYLNSTGLDVVFLWLSHKSRIRKCGHLYSHVTINERFLRGSAVNPCKSDLQTNRSQLKRLIIRLVAVKNTCFCGKPNLVTPVDYIADSRIRQKLIICKSRWPHEMSHYFLGLFCKTKLHLMNAYF